MATSNRHRRARSPHVTDSGGPGRPPLDPLRFFTDVYLLTRRLLTRMARQPDLIVYSIIQPAIFALGLVILFGKTVALPDGTDYANFVVAGLLAQNVVLTAASAASIEIALELRNNTINRLRTLPLSRLSILAGCTSIGIVRAMITVFVTSMCGLLVGWRPQAGIGRIALAYGVLLLLSLALSWLGALIGVSVRSPEAAAGAGTVWLFPVIYLSNAVVPVSGLPDWLKLFAEWNLVSAAATTCRKLFGNPTLSGTGHVWPSDHPVAASLMWSLAIILASAPVAVWKFMRVASR